MRNLILPFAALVLAFAIHSTGLAQSDHHSHIASYLSEHFNELGLQRSDVQHFTIADNYVSPHNGVRHIHITQTHNGFPILNGTANITLDPDERVVHVANRMIAGLPAPAGTPSPALNPADAVHAAAGHLGLDYTGHLEISETKGAHSFVFTDPSLSLETIPVQLVYWASPEHDLQLAWSLSIYQLDAQHWWHAIVDAETGQLIEKIDWVVHCEASVCGTMPGHTHASHSNSMASASPQAVPNSYRVFEFPLESPNHGARTLAIDPADPTASPFGWHDMNGAAGAEFTVTRGNNVNAYEDTLDNNSTGYQPDGGALLEFDFPLNLNNHPRTYIDAAITNLFYVNNRIHDITYRYGFDEASGNFQFNNYGKGGMGFDDVQAEAQDGGGTNNANFATPSDGSNPRMQMYLWTAGTGLPLTVNTPGSIAGVYQAAGAAFGPEVPVTPLTNDVVLVTDTTGPDPNDGCETIQNGADLMGKIALVNRGSCLFVEKVQAAQDEGAIAVIVINNIPGGPIVMGGTSTTITIPSVMISQADGQLLINALGSGDTVNVTLQGQGTSDQIDGDFDNGVVIHEYGHGISNRLTGGPNNAGCLSNDEQMGEGWSDWFGCMMTNDLTRPNPEHRPIGTFVRDNPPNGSGIRNEAYDTSFAVNDYTYGDVSNTALLSQPHGVGFVWATMLWDLTWAFMAQYGYDGDLENTTGGDNIVMQLVMDGLKLQPCNPGFVDGRDAILLADQLNNGGANQCLIWKVFARRGLGFSASQGSSFSRTDQTEAFDLPPICQTPVSAPSAQFVADTTVTCSGKIQFTDLSTDIPQQWHWDFGDGTSSTDQDPAHTYTTPGTYTVKLVVSNTLGADSLVRTAYIDFSPPEDPIIPPPIGCAGESVVLSATASGTVNWMDAGNNVLATGATFNTPVLTGNTTFHAVNEYGSPAQHVGPVDENFGTGGNHNTAFTGTVDFTADVPLTIRSAYVVAGSPGPRTVFLWDAHSAGGNVIDQVSINPSAGAQRVTLDFEVPGPGNYSIGLSNADLYRNNAGTNYPYTIPGVISIVGSSAGPDFYYYLYDLEVKQASCYSDTVAVTVTVLDSVDFEFQDTGLTVDFTDLSGAGSGWQWDFGDGNTSTDQHPTHTYAANGTYTVTLTVGPCSQTYEVTVTGVGINQLEMEGTTLTVQPNPATDATLLKVSQPLTRDVPFRLMSLDGRLVHAFTLPAGETQWTLDLSTLPASVYWLVADGQPGAALQVVVLR